MQEALFLNKKISEIVKRGKTIFKSKIKWILALVLLTGCIYGSYTLSRYTEADQVEAKQAQVILDAGHGGSDPGKIGLNNLLEKDINLAITKKVKKCLEKEKITAELTRKEDKGLGTTGDGSKKTEDMQARVKMINETKPVLTVSIHQNSYSDPGVKGPQVFYYEDSEGGKELALAIQENMNRKLSIARPRVAKENRTYYLLKRSPGVINIVECGFLTNPEEAALLQTEKYQRKVAEAVADGIVTYLKKQKENENN